MSPRTPDPGRATLLSEAPASLKLAATFALVLAITLLPRTLGPVYLAPAAVLMVLWMVSRMPLLYGLRRLLVAEFFIIGIGFMTLFSPGAAPVFAGALVKSNLCVLGVVLLTWTTPFTEILTELGRIHVPGLMLTTLALMVRYLPVVAGESRRMQRARASRTFTDQRWVVWQSLGEVASRLFVRSAKRAEHIYLAMCARGWK